MNDRNVVNDVFFCVSPVVMYSTDTEGSLSYWLMSLVETVKSIPLGGIKSLSCSEDRLK